MTSKVKDYLAFYLGCRTNQGELIGIQLQTVFIQRADGEVVNYDVGDFGSLPKPFLRRLHHLSAEESSALIEKGLSIGRPMGYGFSPQSFLYLLSLRVDLFGLIDSGLALDLAELQQNIC